MPKILQIKTILKEPELIHKYEEIKRSYGLKSHAETIRLLIAKEYNRLYTPQE